MKKKRCKVKRVEYIFGAGTTFPKQEGRVNVDRIPLPNVDVVWDLDKFQYPFPDGSGLHINATHLIEHLQPKTLPKFFDECHRILNPGGTLYIETPHAQHIDLTASDPTHQRTFTKHTFINYITVQGVRNFGYTRHAWAILDIRPAWEHLTGDVAEVLVKTMLYRLFGCPAPLTEFKERGVIKVLAMPIPDEMLQNEILNRMNR